MSMTMSSILLSMKGSISATICAGMLATVISQADTSAAATRNITIDEVLAAFRMSPYKSLTLISR